MGFFKKLFETKGSAKEWVLRFKDGAKYIYLDAGGGIALNPKDAWIAEKDIHNQHAMFLGMDKNAFFNEIEKRQTQVYSVLGPTPTESEIWTTFCRTNVKSLRESKIINEAQLRTAQAVSLDQAVKDYNMEHR